MSRSSRAWVSFSIARVFGIFVDILALGVAYWCSYLLRFDFHSPRWGWLAVAMSFISAGATMLAAMQIFGCYRLSWRRTSLRVLPRYIGASFLACAGLTALRFALPVDTLSHVRPPYSIVLIYMILSVVAVFGWRVIWMIYARSRQREDDLLERRVRKMDTSIAANFIRGKTVMITGAGGSIGSELVRQVAAASPKLLLLVERGENALYEIDRELRQTKSEVAAVPLMLDINERERMDEIFSRHQPEVVIHAAAYKHVPMVEMNPREGERNNTEATKLLAELALKHKVRRFVLISTDKAVNPVSTMGKTKLAAEKAIMALNGGDTSFCAVRFGNVFGSSGSVVPLFREQIKKHQPVTVTHPDMKRYFMTVEEAVGLVLQAASREERAIYTLDMGEPVSIVDLAEGMIRQAGYRPYVDLPIVFTGMRAGEKLFEELDISEKSCYKTDMAKIYINYDNDNTNTGGIDSGVGNRI